MRQIDLDIAGIGIILYSPPAVVHIAEGEDYLSEHFSEGQDVARHVMECQLTGFCTGTPGTFKLQFRDGPPDARAVEAAEFKLRLGLQVRNGVLCVRDLYDLMEWEADCPPGQMLAVTDGWYRLTVFSSPDEEGFLGEDQVIDINLERVPEKPDLRWDGVPTLCAV